MPLKELYIGRTLADLNDKVDIKSNQFPLDRMKTSMGRLMMEAQKSEKEGDQERAYVLYMKYQEVKTVTVTEIVIHIQILN